MKKLTLLLSATIIGLFAITVFTGCSKKGCTDPNADNYYDKAKKDDGTCIYPTINKTAAGNSGDIKGGGGTASSTWTFTNNNTTAGWDMAIDATSGSFRLVLKDAAGTTVLDKTLTAGAGAQDASGTTSSGTPGTWTCTITLTNFNGTGDYSFI